MHHVKKPTDGHKYAQKSLWCVGYKNRFCQHIHNHIIICTELDELFMFVHVKPCNHKRVCGKHKLSSIFTVII